MEDIYRANTVALIRLLETALAVPGNRIERHQVDDALINSCIESKRSGLPDDAVCVRYYFETPHWEMEVRATWWQGSIYKRRGIHCDIVAYVSPDSAEALSDDELAERVNNWLRGCSLL